MGVMDLNRCIKVSGLLGRVHRFSQKLLAETTACPKRTTALKAHTSLFLLAEARVRRKLISCQASHIHGFKGRPHKTPQNYHEILFGRFPVLNRLNGKILTSMLRSRSCGISIPLARKTLDMQDLYPCWEDIASFFSSNRKMRKSGNCWTVALTGIIAYNGSTLRVRVHGKLSAYREI